MDQIRWTKLSCSCHLDEIKKKLSWLLAAVGQSRASGGGQAFLLFPILFNISAVRNKYTHGHGRVAPIVPALNDTLQCPL